MSLRKYILIGSALLLLAIGLGVVWVSTIQNPQGPEIECYEEQVQTMTVQEAANLLQMPLAELTWLPDDLRVTPNVSAYAGFSDCWVVVEYRLPESSQNIATISINNESVMATKPPANCSWQFTPTEAIRTDCYLYVDGASSTLRLSLYVNPEHSPENALQILDGIVVIEPSG